MELFTFARSECLLYNLLMDRLRSMIDRSCSHAPLIRWRARATVGGDQERVEIHLIAHPDDDQTEARRSLTEQFATFDAGKARCFLASDREHLLAVIEAGFGDFDDFNRIARNLLASRLHDKLSSRSPSRRSTSP